MKYNYYNYLYFIEIQGNHEDDEEEVIVDDDVTDEEPFYNKTKSFFDNISCDGKKDDIVRMRWKEEKKLNTETFGTAGYYRRGRGRGGFNNFRGRGGGFRGQNNNMGGQMSARGGYRGYQRRNNNDWINYEYNYNAQQNHGPSHQNRRGQQTSNRSAHVKVEVNMRY